MENWRGRRKPARPARGVWPLGLTGRRPSAQSGARPMRPIASRVTSFPTDLRYRLEYAGFRLIQAAISTRPLEAASRETGMAWRLIAPRLHRQKRALRQSRPRLSRHAAQGTGANRGRHVGEPRPHLRRRLFPQTDHGRRAGHFRTDGAIARNRPRRPLHRLRPPSRQLGACRLCRQAHGRAVHRRLSALEQPLRRRRDAQIAPADLRRGACAEDRDRRPDAAQEGEGRRLSGVPRRSARRSRRGAFPSSALSRARPSSRPCSPARPGFPSTPAPRFAAPMSVS